jgi:hypothetical protein
VLGSPGVSVICSTSSSPGFSPNDAAVGFG